MLTAYRAAVAKLVVGPWPPAQTLALTVTGFHVGAALFDGSRRACGHTWFRWRLGAGHQCCKPRERVFAVAFLGAKALRLDQYLAILRKPPTGQPLKPCAYILGQSGPVQVQPQLHRGRHLVHVLAAGA